MLARVTVQTSPLVWSIVRSSRTPGSPGQTGMPSWTVTDISIQRFGELFTLPSYTETPTRHTHVLANTTKWKVFATLAIIAIAALYLVGLTRMGMYSTDEPRYAD